jgi:membrane protease YdiL (CAAX protease family)
MKKKWLNILAICIGVLPVYVLMIWYRLTHTESFTTSDMLLYPLLIGGANILLILALNRYLLRQKFSGFNAGKRRWYWDVLAGMILTVLCFVLLLIGRVTIGRMLPPGKPPSQEVINLMTDLARNPLYLAIWLGPVVWIGVALFEELSRAFFLNCLWRLSGNKSWEVLAVFLVSAVIGLVHVYQGAFGVISVGIQGFLLGFYYYKFRRLWPLVISHALYDSIQVIMFVMQVS